MKILHKKKLRRFLKGLLLVLLAIVLCLCMNFPAFLSEKQATYYSTKIFPKVSIIPNTFSNLSHISITENLVVVGGTFLIIGLIYLLVKIIVKATQKDLGSFLFKLIRNALVISIVLSISFQLMHGINYRRTSVSKELNLEAQNYEYEDYLDALKWAYEGMITARMELGMDYSGVGHMSTNLEQTSLYANVLLNQYCEEHDIGLSDSFIRAKAVSLSDYWAQTNIVGMYDVFLGEANINTGYMDIQQFPRTVCHEIAHAKGFASETDCNLLATLACTNANRADFRYCGYFNIYSSLYGAVKNISQNTGDPMPDFINSNYMEYVYKDSRASNDYWNKIRSGKLSKLIADISDFSNDTFLKANGQSGGTKTYKIPYNVYVNYYKIYIEGNNA